MLRQRRSQQYHSPTPRLSPKPLDLWILSTVRTTLSRQRGALQPNPDQEDIRFEKDDFQAPGFFSIVKDDRLIAKGLFPSITVEQKYTESIENSFQALRLAVVPVENTSVSQNMAYLLSSQNSAFAKSEISEQIRAMLPPDNFPNVGSIIFKADIGAMYRLGQVAHLRGNSRRARWWYVLGDEMIAEEKRRETPRGKQREGTMRGRMRSAVTSKLHKH